MYLLSRISSNVFYASDVGVPSAFVCRETIFGHFDPLILLLASFGFYVFHCRHIVRKSSTQKFNYCLYGICTQELTRWAKPIMISGPMPRYCSKHLFRLLYYIMRVNLFFPPNRGGSTYRFTNFTTNLTHI